MITLLKKADRDQREQYRHGRTERRAKEVLVVVPTLKADAIIVWYVEYPRGWYASTQDLKSRQPVWNWPYVQRPAVVAWSELMHVMNGNPSVSGSFSKVLVRPAVLTFDQLLKAGDVLHCAH